MDVEARAAYKMRPWGLMRRGKAHGRYYQRWHYKYSLSQLAAEIMGFLGAGGSLQAP